jgi:hypothetical protein
MLDTSALGHHDLRRAHTRGSLKDAGWTDAQIASAIRDGRLTRVFPGTYMDGDGAVTPTDRVRCATAHLGDDVVAALGTAAQLHGLPAPWPSDDTVHLALPPGREQLQRPGARIHTWILGPAETTTIAGIRVTTALRTLVDLMCTADKLSAVAALDAALRLRLVNPAQVAAMPSVVRRRRGAARSRTWWALGDGRAESPLESRVRVRAIDGGYPPDDLQYELNIEGHSYRSDLAWLRAGRRVLLLEADGDAFHSTSLAIANDRKRANAILETGLADLARCVWNDTVAPATVPALLARHLGPPRTPPTVR